MTYGFISPDIVLTFIIFKHKYSPICSILNTSMRVDYYMKILEGALCWKYIWL